MKELLYLEIPTPATDAVCTWLQKDWQPEIGEKIITPSGIRLKFSGNSPTSETALIPEISIFVWSVQRTTYLKAFRWCDREAGEKRHRSSPEKRHRAIPQESQILAKLTTALRQQFPNRYPQPPAFEPSKQSIFEALAPDYPKTVHFFQKIPNGEYDLNRAYWWEKRWREGVLNPQTPKQVVFKAGGQG
ncbi:MAG TPA: flavin-dependent dehydrogenase, partial [Cyanobacteria bacterium UBA11159]|nr:flavin-dependent dehydrogenase [Cyanobacteria bacterium UBA11166]HBR73342.1 flavin-dependent dehydrogenase [Cyanobacteria bacterium UBA11159]